MVTVSMIMHITSTTTTITITDLVEIFNFSKNFPWLFLVRQKIIGALPWRWLTSGHLRATLYLPRIHQTSRQPSDKEANRHEYS